MVWLDNTTYPNIKKKLLIAEYKIKIFILVKYCKKIINVSSSFSV